jgi:cytochrome c peroxidase
VRNRVRHRGRAKDPGGFSRVAGEKEDEVNKLPVSVPAYVRQLRRATLLAACAALLATSLVAFGGGAASATPEASPEARLRAAMRQAGFTGKIASTLTQRLGRPIDPILAKLGGALFFDTLGGLHDDNSCAGCHSPSAGFADTQSMAIGVNSNGVVGPGRKGPRNQRRSPSVLNTAFYPTLMWNGRFFAPSGDPFSNAMGFSFPAPEGTTQFAANDPKVPHLLAAQAHMPFTVLPEMAGFTGTSGTIGPRYDAFDDGLGSPVPAPDGYGYRNDPIRDAVLARLNGTPAYVDRFAAAFTAVANGKPIDFTMVGRAIAEFEFTLVRANAPADRFARGDDNAMSDAEKRGAATFFGAGRCVSCHAAAGTSNQMFSDFRMRNIGVPQIAPAFGPGLGNVLFDGADESQDFGVEQVTGNKADRYMFRTSPLRNVSLQPTFFHNGAFTKLEDAIRHHLDVAQSNASYDPAAAGVRPDLRRLRGPSDRVLATLDPLLAEPIVLTQDEFDDLVSFVRKGLLDPDASRASLCTLIPNSVPSGRPLPDFRDC